MLTYHLLLKFSISSHFAATVLTSGPSSTSLFTMDSAQTTSKQSITPHFSVSPRRRQQTCIRIFIFLSEPRFLHFATASTPKNCSSTKHVLTIKRPQIASNKSDTPYALIFCCCQYQIYMLGHSLLFQNYIPPYTAAALLMKSRPATHLITKHTSQTT